MLMSTVGTVFNLVHGSFVDGWGIRSTVFLKGCPLRCKWCCNPESQRPEPELQFIQSHCSGCGKCVSACPKGALHLKDHQFQISRNLCDGCGQCVKRCWAGALAVWGTRRSAESVFQDCKRHIPFYQASGGGVTLSGGEPTLQPEFCLELLERCHRENISVAVDTCGHVTSELGLEVLRQADLLLFDIKGLDAAQHKSSTGLSNEVILQNLRRAEDWGKEVIIRCPTIPHYNRDEAASIAALLSNLHCVKRVDLIPYHDFGRGKYEELGRQYPLKETPMTQEEQQALLSLYQSYGLPAQLGG